MELAKDKEKQAIEQKAKEYLALNYPFQMINFSKDLLKDKGHFFDSLEKRAKSLFGTKFLKFFTCLYYCIGNKPPIDWYFVFFFRYGKGFNGIGNNLFSTFSQV